MVVLSYNSDNAWIILDVFVMHHVVASNRLYFDLQTEGASVEKLIPCDTKLIIE